VWRGLFTRACSFGTTWAKAHRHIIEMGKGAGREKVEQYSRQIYETAAMTRYFHHGEIG